MKLKEVLKEVKQDIRRVNKDKLGTNTMPSKTIDAFVQEGFRGVYDLETGHGTVTYSGVKVEFDTGSETLHITINDLYTRDNPFKAIKKLKEFLEYATNYQ